MSMKRLKYLGAALLGVIILAGIVRAAGTPTSNPLQSLFQRYEQAVRLIMGVPLPTGNESAAYEGTHLFNTCLTGESGSQCTASLEGLCVSMHTAALRNLLIIDGAAVPSNGAVGSCANT